MSHLLVYVTCGNEAEARAIGRSVVEKRLAACANILPAMRSIYWWKDRLEEADEAVLLFKTREDLFEPLREHVISLHSYDVACVVALPFKAGHAPYLAWIDAETGAGPLLG
jgi:periplasmic divalent cation tolerance protein